MSDIAALVSNHLDIWTAATERKSGAGRGGGKRLRFYGIERLRALILDLALCGRVVTQIASDEPASDLMKRVGQERAALGAKVSKAEAVAPPPDLPSGWVAVRLADLANPQAGFAFKSVGFNELDVGLPLIRIRDVGQPFTGTFYSGDYRDEFVVLEGDYLISMDGEFRVAMWIGPDALLNQRVSRLQFYGDEVVRPFVAMALQAELTKLQGVKAYTTVDHLSGKQIAGSLILLPPLAEQQRIVAKVDELMALCDALEGESAAALAAHQTLVETLLATLVNSADAADLAANWTRLEDHFDTLFTTEASVEALKQTVLELAVRGRLTRPEHEDGQVEQLLADIAEHRKLKVKQGRRRAPDAPARAINGAELPFVIPEHWQFARFQDVLINRDAERIPVSSEERVNRKGEYDYYGASGVIDKIDRFLFEDPLLLIGEDGANLINRSTPIAFVARGKYWVNNHAHVLEACSETLLRYMEIFINAIDLKPYVTGTAQPKMNQAKMNSIIVALAPVDEMKRVVAKVDALMILCDDLKARITDAGQIQMRLAGAIVERAAA